MSTQRQPGFYFVRAQPVKWEVAQWDAEGFWSLTGSHRQFKDADFIEINESRIPAPDESMLFSPAEIWERAVEDTKQKINSLADHLEMHEYVHEDSVKGYWSLSEADRKEVKHLDVDELTDKVSVENPFDNGSQSDFMTRSIDRIATSYGLSKDELVAPIPDIDPKVKDHYTMMREKLAEIQGFKAAHITPLMEKIFGEENWKEARRQLDAQSLSVDKQPAPLLPEHFTELGSRPGR